MFFKHQIVRHHLLRAKEPNSTLCFEVGNMPRLKIVWQWVTSQSNNAIETFKTPSMKKNNTFTSPRGRNSQSCSLLKWFLPSKVLMGRIKIFSLTLNSATIYNKLNLKHLIPDLNDLTMDAPLPPSKISHLLFCFQGTYSWGFDIVNVHLWWIIGSYMYTTPPLYQLSTIVFTGFHDQVC